VIFYLVNYPDDDIKPLGFANVASAWNLAVEILAGLVNVN
jgi:hypothetical protein